MRNIWQIVVLSVVLLASLGCPSGGSKKVAGNEPVVGAELTVTVSLPPEEFRSGSTRIVEVYSADEQIGSIGCAFDSSGSSNFWLGEGSHNLRFESPGMKVEKRKIRILAQGHQSIHIDMVKK